MSNSALNNPQSHESSQHPRPDAATKYRVVTLRTNEIQYFNTDLGAADFMKLDLGDFRWCMEVNGYAETETHIASHYNHPATEAYHRHYRAFLTMLDTIYTEHRKHRRRQ